MGALTGHVDVGAIGADRHPTRVLEADSFVGRRRFASACGFGYTRIGGELGKLASRSTRECRYCAFVCGPARHIDVGSIGAYGHANRARDFLGFCASRERFFGVTHSLGAPSCSRAPVPVRFNSTTE